MSEPPQKRRGATRYKLQEAEFFLGFLKSHYGYQMKFDFYLSARAISLLRDARRVRLLYGVRQAQSRGREALERREEEMKTELGFSS